MKKKLMIILMALLLSACGNNKVECISDNAAVCEVLSIADFEIEENAQILIGVFDEAYGISLIEKLEVKFPGVYSFEVIQENDLSDISKFDIVQSKVEDVPLLFDSLSPVSKEFSTLLSNDYISSFSSVVNQEDFYFVPFDIKGLLFAYNATLLTELGVDLTDENNDGIADSIDSFEKIGELAVKWKAEEKTYLDKPIKNIFSFPFNDQLAMLSFIENSNYKLVTGFSGEDINIEDDLVNALQHFSNLSKYPWDFDNEKYKEMSWNYEDVLIDQSAPFLLVGNWMFYEQYQKSQAYDLVFSKLPMINDENISSLSTVSGFVLNNKSEYPNAQNQAIKEIRSPEMIEMAISKGIIPIVDPLFLEEFSDTISPNIAQQILAYTYSNSIELQAFMSDPSVRAYDIYYDVDFRDIYKKVFFKEITVEQGQLEIKEKIAKWLDEHNLEVEGINYELETDNTEGSE